MGPAGGGGVVPVGVWLLGVAGVLVAWLLAAPLVVPAVVVVGGVAVLAPVCAHLAGLLAAGGRPGPVGPAAPAAAAAAVVAVPRPALPPPAAGALSARVAWRCGQAGCAVAGWSGCGRLVYLDAELHTAVDHPGRPAVWRLVGATAVPRVGAA